MRPIEDVAAECRESEKLFKKKKILWIGSESYVAPAITVLQGLDTLGFEIYTLFKSNINSFFCNRIIDSGQLEKMDFDFVLSATHWGTDYPAYDRYSLGKYPNVLIDGDDSAHGETWQMRYQKYCKEYAGYPESKRRKKWPRFDERWMAPLDGYEPDILFTMQKQLDLEGQGHYIPSGIHYEYLSAARDLAANYDFCHFPTAGAWRQAMNDLICLGILPKGATVFNNIARGKPIFQEDIVALAQADQQGNVHSYHRWAVWQDYFTVLNSSRILIHPGIDKWPFWDCKRPYEGWACGCLVLMQNPCTDVSDYSPTGIWPDGVYVNYDDFQSKALFYFQHPALLHDARMDSRQRAESYLTPVPIARYFLKRVADGINDSHNA
jgi:hypothetical protein